MDQSFPNLFEPPYSTGNKHSYLGVLRQPHAMSGLHRFQTLQGNAIGLRDPCRRDVTFACLLFVLLFLFGLYEWSVDYYNIIQVYKGMPTSRGVR